MQLALQTMTSYRATLDLARWAEAAGLPALAVADHYLSGPDQPYALDQLTLLGAVAEATERIELSTLVSPVTFRHPAVMLKAGVTLDEISGGRFTLGVGAGWMEDEHEAFGFDFPPLRERFERLEEALAYLRAATSDTGDGHAGGFYRLPEGFHPAPTGETLRLVVGGSGATRTPTLAGKYADEYNAFPSEVPLASRITAFREAAEQAGRDSSQLLVSAAFPLVVGESEAEVGARFAKAAKDRGTEPGRVRERWSTLGVPFGTPDQVGEGLAALETAGVSRVYFQVAFEPLEAIQRSFGLIRT